MTSTIAWLALLASGVSIYFQFFHKPRRLRFISMPAHGDGKIRFGLCNSGKVNVFITGMSVNFYWPISNSKTQKFCSAGNLFCTQKILAPGDIAEHILELAPPPQPVFEHISPKKNPNGEEERSLDIGVSVQFAFPDGKIYSNDFKMGSYSIIDAGKERGFEIYDLNLDLIKTALPSDSSQQTPKRKSGKQSRGTKE